MLDVGVRIWSNWNSHTLLKGVWNGTSSLGKDLIVYCTFKHTSNLQPKIPSLDIYPREMKICVYKNVYKYIFRISIHNDPKLETILVFIHRRINEQTVIYSLWLSGYRMCLQCRRHRKCRFNSWVRKIPWRRAWQPTPVFLPGESHGSKSPKGLKESDTTKKLSTRVTVTQRILHGS